MATEKITYVTNDGRYFSDEQKALQHEREAEIAKEVCRANNYSVETMSHNEALLKAMRFIISDPIKAAQDLQRIWAEHNA